MHKILIIGFLFFTVQGFSQDLTRTKTIIEPHIQAKIQKGNNMVYCASFQIAWDNLCDSIIKGDIQLQESPDYLKHLNANNSDGVIDSNYVLVKSDISNPNFLNELDFELKEKFNKSFHFPNELKKTDLVSVSFLRKKIDFYASLDDAFEEEEVLIFENRKVDFFGLKYGWTNPTYKEKLRIHDYKSADDFIFQVVTKQEEDEIYFAKIEPKETLEMTYNSVIERIKLDHISYLGVLDQVRIPYLNLNTIKHYTEIEGQQITNENFEKYTFSESVQIIDFNLNEAGVSLESFSYGHAYELDALAQKKLIFDKPFLLIVKQKDSKAPYLLMWVSNTELMKKP